MIDLSKVTFEYSIPLYHAEICVTCMKGYDSHKSMFSGRTTCTCGEPLKDIVSLELDEARRLLNEQKCSLSSNK